MVLNTFGYVKSSKYGPIVFMVCVPCICVVSV